MTIDDLLIAITIAGIGLSGAYLRAELLLHRRVTAAQRNTEHLQLELHTKRLRVGKNEMSGQSRTVPTSNVLQTTRVLGRALLNSPRERKFKVDRERAGTGAGYGL